MNDYPDDGVTSIAVLVNNASETSTAMLNSFIDPATPLNPLIADIIISHDDYAREQTKHGYPEEGFMRFRVFD